MVPAATGEPTGLNPTFTVAAIPAPETRVNAAIPPTHAIFFIIIILHPNKIL
jgi:hypothetical protein